MIKILSKLGIQGNFLNLLKSFYGTLTANIILNGKKLYIFLLRSRTIQECPLLSQLFNIVLEVLAYAIRKFIESIWIGKEEIKVSLFTDDMIFYVKNLKELTKTNKLTIGTK